MNDNSITLIEATALEKLIKKVTDKAKKSGEKLGPGNYNYDFTVKCDGSMSRGADTEVMASFKMNDLLKAVILRYAQEMDEPAVWIAELLAVDGALGAVVQLGASAVLKTVKPELEAIWDNCEAAAKAKHKLVAGKNSRAGNTSVVGAVEKVPNYGGDLGALHQPARKV